MKKSLPIILVLLAIIMIGGCMSCNIQRSLVGLDEDVKAKWANVQNQYQRRADLIPNLVATVKGVADFEKSTYVLTAQARAGQLKNIAQNTSADDLTPEKMAQLQEASRQAQESARMMINVAIEAYPNLKANESFLKLQDDLSGTENRIAEARRQYNETVQTYNVQTRVFPNNIFAGMLGFKARATFEADAAAQKAPSVKF
jgi:LemA protein